MSSFLVIFLFSYCLQNWIIAQDFLDLNKNDFDPNKNFKWVDSDKKVSRPLVEVEPDLENFKATIRYDAFTTIQVRILYDKKKKMIAYKDLRNDICLLEKISGSKKSPIHKLPAKKEEESKENDKVPKMFFLSNVVLKRKKVRKFAGKKIMTFCDGLKTSFLKEMPFAHNELPESEERKNERKKLREQFFEFLNRNPNEKNNREKRQIRNRFRGQTQTQFLTFGDGKGSAEAVAQPEISKTIVSGVNGIGQAQSQSGGADCDGCYPGEGSSRFGTGFRTGIGRETGRPESETPIAGLPGISDSRRGSEGTLPDSNRGMPGYRGGPGDGRDITGGTSGGTGIPGSRGETGGPGTRTGGGFAGTTGGSGGSGDGLGGPGYTGTVDRGDGGGPVGAGYPGTPGGRGDTTRPGSSSNGHGYPGTPGGRGDIGKPRDGDEHGYPGASGGRPGIETGGPGTGIRDSSGRPIDGDPGSKTDGRGGNGFSGQGHGRPGEFPGTNGQAAGRYPPSASSKPYYPNGIGHTQSREGAGTTGGTGVRYPPSASSKPFHPGGEGPGHGSGAPGGPDTHSGGTGVRYPPSASSKPYYPSGETPGQRPGVPGGTGTHIGGTGARYPPSASSKPYYPGGGIPGHGSGAGTHVGGTGARYPPSASSKPYYPGVEIPGHGTGAGTHSGGTGVRYPPSASSKPYYPGGEIPGHGTAAGTHPGGTGVRYPPSASSKPYYPNGQLQPGSPGTSGAKYPPSASSKPHYPPSGGSRPTNVGPVGPGQISPGVTNGQTPGRYPPSASSKPYYPSTNGQQPSYPGHLRPGSYHPSASSKPFYPPGTGGQHTPGSNGQVPSRFPPSASSKPFGPKNGQLPPSSGNDLQPPARYPPSSSSKLYPPSGDGNYIPGRNGNSGTGNGQGQLKPTVPDIPPLSGSKPLHPSQGGWDGRHPEQSGFQPGRYPPSASSKPYYPPSSHSQPQPQPQPQPHPQPHFQPQQPSYPDGPGQIRPNIIFGEHGQMGVDQYGGQEVPCESELPGGTTGIGGYPGTGRPGEGGHHIPTDHQRKPGGNGYGQYPGGVHGGTHPGSTYPGGHQSASGHPTIHAGTHQGPGVPGEHGTHPGTIYPGSHQGPSGSSQPSSGYPSSYRGPSGSGQPDGHTGASYPGGHQGPSAFGHPSRHLGAAYPGKHLGPSTSDQSGIHTGSGGTGQHGSHQGVGGSGYPGTHHGPGGASYPGSHSEGHLGSGAAGQGGARHPSTHPGIAETGQTDIGSAGYPDHSGRPGTGQAGTNYPGANGISQPGSGEAGRPGYYPGGVPGGQTPGGPQTPIGGRPIQHGPGDQTIGQRPGWGDGGTGYPGAGTSQSGAQDGRLGGGRADGVPQTGGFPETGTQTGGYPGTGTQTGGYPGTGAQTGDGGAGVGAGVGAAEGSGTGLCPAGTDCKSGEESQVQTSVTQDKNATRALSSAQGRFGAGIAQAQVSGVYTGSGSFSAQAQTSDNDKGAQVQVIGGSRGASSSAQGMGGRGQTQAQVQLGSQNGATSAEAQSGGFNFGTNTQVQAGGQGGLADAQADGPGSTSSQAQIGVTPYTNKTDKERDQKVPFQGGVSASAQSGANVGQSQTDLFGSFYNGISYTGSAQAGSGKGFNKLKNRNSTIVNSTEDEKQSMTQLGFTNKNGLPPLPKFGQGILKDFNIHEPVDQEIESKKANGSGEIPDLVKEKPDREELEPVTSTSGPKTGGNYGKDKSNPKIDKDAEILETKDKEEEDDDEYEEEEYDELEELKKAKPIKYKQGEGIDTKYGSVIEKDQTITVNQKSPTQVQTVFIGGLDKKHDVHIEQDADEQVKEGDILQPGDRILGEDGFTIPEGYRGKVTSVAGQIGKTRAQAPDGGRAQSQTVLVKPGTGKIHYTNPRPYRGDQLRYAPHLGKYISNIDDPAGKISNGFDYTYTPPYASSSIINNGQKKYSNTYYSRSSGCGYYTFSCDVVFGSNGRAKICKPNPPTNPDGSPCVI